MLLIPVLWIILLVLGFVNTDIYWWPEGAICIAIPLFCYLLMLVVPAFGFYPIIGPVLVDVYLLFKVVGGNVKAY